MKKIFLTTLLFWVLGNVGFLFAQQSNDIKINDKENKSIDPDVRITIQKEMDDEGNTTKMDSTYIWSWSEKGEIPMAIMGEFNILLENFDNNFLFHFQDSTFGELEFHDFFNNNFNQYFEDFKRDLKPFQEEHLKKMQEKFKHFFSDDFHLKWDEKMELNKELFHQRFKELEDKIWEFQQRYQNDTPHEGTAL